MDSSDLVRRLWLAYEARNWSEARRLFAPGAECLWPTSGERFVGPAIVDVNENYPEGWTISIIEIAALADSRVLSIVKVAHPPNVFFATSLFTIENGLIARMVEYWATFEEPPEWRKSPIPQNGCF